MKLRTCLSLLLLRLSVVAAETDYCSFSPQHVLCNNPDASNVNTKNCGTVVYRGVTDSDKQTILKEHNNLRSDIAEGNEGQPKASNMMEMEWDDELALVAQAVADTCVFQVTSPSNRRVERFYVGLNLYGAYAFKGDYVTVWEKAVASWKSGLSSFQASTIGSYTFDASSASYSQLVWGSSCKVGCGLIAKVDGQYNKGTYVCMYGPGGNMNGAPVYEVGEPCSACPEDNPCSSTYPGLCGGATRSNETDVGGPAFTTTTPEPGEGGQCSSDYCSFTAEHTLCKYPEGTISEENCGVPPKRLLSSAERRIVLDEHNKYRSRVAEGKESGQPAASNMREMVYDEELAAVAQALADQCVFEHDCGACRRVKRFAVGQNIYTSSTTAPTYSVDWPAAVKSWYDEVSEFNNSYIHPFKFTYATGHYTQVVWADSWKLGCGFISYVSGQWKKGFYVCNYGSAGNYANEAMYLKGTSCTACPENTECSEDYDGLCASTLPDECAAAATTTTEMPTTTTETITPVVDRCQPRIILGPKKVELDDGVSPRHLIREVEFM